MLAKMPHLTTRTFVLQAGEPNSHEFQKKGTFVIRSGLVAPEQEYDRAPAQHRPHRQLSRLLPLTHVLLPPAPAKECAHVGDTRQLKLPTLNSQL